MNKNFIINKNENSIEVEKDYFITNIFTEADNIGCSLVKSKLVSGRHPLMKNTESNRIYYILSGSVKFVIDGEEVSLQKGETLCIRKNTKYSFDGDFEALLFSIPAFKPEHDVIYK